MKEVERLLELDRNAPVPELPEPAFTTAAVAGRLGRLRSARPTPPEQWLLAGAAAVVGLGAIGLALAIGAAPYWLLAVPLLLVPLFPILRKGVR